MSTLTPNLGLPRFTATDARSLALMDQLVDAIDASAAPSAPHALIDKGGSVWNARNWGFAKSGWLSTAASITAGTSTLTVTDRTLTTADVGLVGWVRGIGQFGKGPSVPAMISAVTSPTTATLTRYNNRDDPNSGSYNSYAVTTVTNATAAFAPQGDGDAFQQMLDFLTTNGGRGVIPPGIYYLDRRTSRSGGDPTTNWQIVPRSNVEIHGSSVGATTLLCPALTSAWTAVLPGASSRFGLAHLRILGAGTLYESTLALDQVTDLSLEDLLLDSAGYTGLWLRECVRPRLRHITIQNVQANVYDGGTSFTSGGGFGIWAFQGNVDGEMHDVFIHDVAGAPVVFDAGHGVLGDLTSFAAGNNGWTAPDVITRDTGTWVGTKLDIPQTVGIVGHSDGVLYNTAFAALTFEGSARNKFTNLDIQRHGVALAGSTATGTIAAPAVQFVPDQSASANPPNDNVIEGKVQDIGGPAVYVSGGSSNRVALAVRNAQLVLAAGGGGLVDLLAGPETSGEVLNNPGDPNYNVVGMLTPASQASTAAEAILAGSTLSAVGLPLVRYTLSAATHAVNWRVYGSNDPTFITGETLVQDWQTVQPSATGTYLASTAPYSNLRVKIVDTIAGTHGTATISGWAATVVATSTAAEAVVAGSVLDTNARPFVYLRLTAATNSVNWRVYGSNDPAWPAPVLVQDWLTSTTATAAIYQSSASPYRYLRVSILDTVGGSHGTATIAGWASAIGTTMLDTSANLVEVSQWQDDLIVEPAAQLSTDTETVITGSALNATGYDSFRFRAYNVGQNYRVIVRLYSATLADFSDEALITTSPTNPAPGQSVEYLESPKLKTYYRVKIYSAVAGNAASIVARLVAIKGYVSYPVVLTGGTSAVKTVRNVVRAHRLPWRPGVLASVSGTLSLVPRSGVDENRVEYLATDDPQDGLHLSFGTDRSTRFGPYGVNALAQRPPTGATYNPQEFQVYGRYDDASNYTRLVLRSSAQFGHSLVVEGAGTYATRELTIGTVAAGNLYLQTNNTTRWYVGASGMIFANADNTYDVGDPTHRARDIYVGRNLILAGELQTASAATATGPVGTVVKKHPVYDTTGTLLGYLPIYNTIT